MELISYENGNKRIHVDRDDDGSIMRATLLTNPKRGFRKRLGGFKNEEELSTALAQGFVETSRKVL